MQWVAMPRGSPERGPMMSMGSSGLFEFAAVLDYLDDNVDIFAWNDKEDIGTIQYNDRPAIRPIVDNLEDYLGLIDEWIIASAALPLPLTLEQAQQIKIELAESLFNVKRQRPLVFRNKILRAQDRDVAMAMEVMVLGPLIDEINSKVVDHYNNNVNRYLLRTNVIGIPSSGGVSPYPENIMQQVGVQFDTNVTVPWESLTPVDLQLLPYEDALDAVGAVSARRILLQAAKVRHKRELLETLSIDDVVAHDLNWYWGDQPPPSTDGNGPYTNRIFLDVAGENGNWLVPVNFRPDDNAVECIGGGGTGQVAQFTGSILSGFPGGGGGGYAKRINAAFTPGGSVQYGVADHGEASWVADVCRASGGLLNHDGPATMLGGTPGEGLIGDVRYSGGRGGGVGGNGGGGGAAGPRGNGLYGSSDGGQGGNFYGGVGGTHPAGAGGDGTEWVTHGSGGGGGGSGTLGGGGPGGRFGGGAGTGSVPGTGLIVISWNTWPL